MRVHILGICGTFMGGLAILASQLKFKVTGSDGNVYPPMSTQLASLGIELTSGYEADQVQPEPDSLIVGNVMRRGMPVIEAALDKGLKLTSGPEWLYQHVLCQRHVLAVSGTHGKTTTTSMLAWILEYAGLKPGFLIGGVPNNFGVSAHLGEGKYFVVEADEYDSAFFDKRSKFIHYRPRTLIINNIEFDHADIFSDLAAIQKQFHHLVRTVPGAGLIIHPAFDPAVAELLKMGCWTPTTAFDVDEPSSWHARNLSAAKDSFQVCYQGKLLGTLNWELLGQHNINNALAAIAAANHVGVSPEKAIEALSQFRGVKRRLEIKGQQQGIIVYDDFAHHPTAIATTLAGLRAKLGGTANIIAVLDIRSNTMRAGHHREQLPSSVLEADQVFFFQSPDILWDVQDMWQSAKKPGGVFIETEALLTALTQTLRDNTADNTHVVFMSNGGFGGVQNEFLARLRSA